MDGRNSVEVIEPVKKVLYPSPKAQIKEIGSSRTSVKDYMLKIMNKLREYQEKEQLSQTYLRQKNEMILQYQEREEGLKAIIQEKEQLLAELKDNELNLLQEAESRMEQFRKKNNQQIQQLRENAVKSEQELTQKEIMIQQLQTQLIQLDYEMKELRIVGEREQRLNQMIQHYQAIEAQSNQELAKKKQVLIERENDILVLEDNVTELNEQLREKEKIITSLREQEYTCFQNVENLKADFHLQLQVRDEEVRRMSNKKSWLNWFGSDDKGGPDNVLLLLEQEKANRQELEGVKVQLQTIISKLDKERESEKIQNELKQNEVHVELQSLKERESELKQAIEEKEQEISALKAREKSYLQKIQQFTTNLQTMQQKSTSTSSQNSDSNKNLGATSNSPFFKEHHVPPRPEEYFKNQF